MLYSLIHFTHIDLQLFELYDFMKTTNAPIDIYIYSVLVNALCQRGDVAGATRLVDMMTAAGVTPNISTWNVLLKVQLLLFFLTKL